MQLHEGRSDPSTPGVEVLPEGSRLVHIGPPKTGSTSLQAALFAARDDLSRQGVLYPGRSRHPEDAIRAVMERPSYRHHGRVPPDAKWTRFVDEIRAASQPRIMVSSEFLAGAEPASIKRVVDDLGRASTYVVAGLRPLSALLPSQWQQDIRRGARQPFPAWLREVLAGDDDSPTLFWRTHRTDRILASWAEQVGADHVTAITLDGSDRDILFRTIEGFLGLRAGTLVPDPSVVNRSLSYPEAEAVRALNELCAEAGVDWTVHARVVHLGAAKELWRRPPDPSEPLIDLPAWAVDRTLEIDREMIEAVRGLGVRLVGDPAGLLAPPARVAPADPGEASLTPELAARLAMGVLRSTGLAPDPTVRARFRPSEPQGLALHPTGQLVRTLVARAGRRVAGTGRRMWHGVGRRLRRRR